MTRRIRTYRPDDYELVSRLLVDTFRSGASFTNWLQPRWEYMHHHPFIDGILTEDIGVIEKDGQILGVVHPESRMDEVYIQRREDHSGVAAPLVDYAVETFGGRAGDGEQRVLGVYVSELDTELQSIVTDRGLARSSTGGEPNSRYVLSSDVAVPALPDGFHLSSLDVSQDLRRINRILWRGFGHEGPPPDSEIPGRARMKSAPNFRTELTTVTITPEGTYGSYCGMWFVPENRVAYVEPVATDPDYRRMGLGAAVVLESLRRVRAMGATVAWVGSDQAFYTAMGFDVMFGFDLWTKDLDS